MIGARCSIMFIFLFLPLLVDYKLCERFIKQRLLLSSCTVSHASVPGLAGISEVDSGRENWSKLLRCSNVLGVKMIRVSKKLDNPAFLLLCSHEIFAPPPLTLPTSLPFLYHFHTQGKFWTAYHGPGYRSIHSNIRRRQ